MIDTAMFFEFPNDKITSPPQVDFFRNQNLNTIEFALEKIFSKGIFDLFYILKTHF